VSPRDLDLGIVQIRLRMIEELLDDLTTIEGVSSEDLRRDRMLRHAVERILTQVVDLAVSVNSHVAAAQLGMAPQDYRSSFTLAHQAGLVDSDLTKRLQQSVGLRNVLTHEYVDADLDLIASAVGTALADYGAYVRAAARWVRERS
jgi:uncharacterized protein YutE (UPF0331/DUF86 family)